MRRIRKLTYITPKRANSPTPTKAFLRLFFFVNNSHIAKINGKTKNADSLKSKAVKRQKSARTHLFLSTSLTYCRKKISENNENNNENSVLTFGEIHVTA